MDLAEAAEFDLETARGNIDSVRPGMRVLEVSAKTGLGMRAVFDLLQTQLARPRSNATLQLS
jgi:hydrogenase nickel incorporation protein HypB